MRGETLITFPPLIQFFSKGGKGVSLMVSNWTFLTQLSSYQREQVMFYGIRVSFSKSWREREWYNALAFGKCCLIFSALDDGSFLVYFFNHRREK